MDVKNYNEYVRSELSRIHQVLDRFSIDDIGINERYYCEQLQKASSLVWNALMELDNITSPVEEGIYEQDS